MRDATPARAHRTHYEAGWTDSWSHRRCLHKHKTLAAAAKCAAQYGAVGYVFAVEGGVGRELRATEENVVRGAIPIVGTYGTRCWVVSIDLDVFHV